MKVLRRVGLAQRTTVHGLRSAFRTWASESKDTDHAVMELALAHTVGSAVEHEYARSDLLDKRRHLMRPMGGLRHAPRTVSSGVTAGETAPTIVALGVYNL